METKAASTTVSKHEPKPKWLRVKLPTGKKYTELRGLVDKYQLNTICTSGSCPNMGECWGEGTATFMILGNVCTRSCTFCAVATGRPPEYDEDEPRRVAEAIKLMQVKHAVITSVARDDLKDGGASVWAATIRAIRYRNPNCAIEVLIPDFQGKQDQLDIVLGAEPDILNHNIETVKRLQRPIRKTARYDRTFWVLTHAKSREFTTKSGFMLGIGEKQDEVKCLLDDLKRAQVDIITIGQYLQPTPKHAPVYRWVTPEEFEQWREYGLKIGFGVVESGPLVRSSYHADEQSDKYGIAEKKANALTAS